MKKTIPLFLMPPGVFIVCLFSVGLGCLIARRKRFGALCILLGAAMWLLSITPVSNALLRPLEKAYAVPENPTGDVIVLLCGGVWRGVPDLSGTGMPSDRSLARMVSAVRLQRKLKVPIIVSGGTVFGKAPSEADIVKRFLVDLGVPEHRIIVEGNSRDTYENARNTVVELDKRAYSRPVLVTSALHLKRAVWCFQMAGRDVLPFPADIRSLTGMPYTWSDFLPGSYSGIVSALHEYLGLAYYRLAYKFDETAKR